MISEIFISVLLWTMDFDIFDVFQFFAVIILLDA